MSTIWIREFTGGLDTRRLPETSQGGTLMLAKDCHINKGGEVEQRAIFEEVWHAPAGATFGLGALPDRLVVWGDPTDPPVDLPAGWQYYHLEHPSGVPSLGLPDWKVFGSQMVAIAAYDIPGPGTTESFIFLGSTRVTDVNAPGILADSGQPLSLLTWNDKLHVGSGPNVFFSAIRDGDNFTDTGSGFLDTSFRIGGVATIRGLALYDRSVAVFSENAIQIWDFDADPDESVPVQMLPGTGTISPYALLPFRDSDVLYLHKTGVRSLQARDSSRAAATIDIGTPIDTIVSKLYREVPRRARVLAAGVIEPRTGRLWISLYDKIFVLSYYPAAKISAWTMYEPGFIVEYMTVYDDRVYLRSNDDRFFVYGGTGDEYAYDASVEAEMWLPYLDANQPTTAKQFRSMDAAVRGTWELRAGLDPNNDGAHDVVAVVDRTTYPLARIPYEAESTHISLRAVCRAPKSATEPAVFSSAAIHHDLDADEDN